MSTNTTIKTLSLYQPWASLVALGVKMVETRPWTTHYRGPLAIHAAKTEKPSRTFAAQSAALSMTQTQWDEMPFGAIVATCELRAVLPIIDADNPPSEYDVWPPGRGYVSVSAKAKAAGDPLWVLASTPWIRNGRCIGATTGDLTDQFPYGDFTPGRFALILANVQALDEPVPVKGQQRLWDCALPL